MATLIRVGRSLINADQITYCSIDEDGHVEVWLNNDKNSLNFRGYDGRALWDALTDGVPDRLAPYGVHGANRKGA